MRRTLCVFLTLLALFLVGTVVVLSTVVSYFGVDWRDVITEPEMKRYEKLAVEGVPGKIPRIIHQTWKTEDVPERWEGVRRECMELHPD